MKNATKILATVALGAVLAAGSATASMARGGGGGGHGGAPFAMNHGGGFGGAHSFGARPFAMNHGGDRGFGMRHDFNRDHRFDARRHFGRFGDDDDNFAFFGFGPFWGPGQYWAYNGYGAGYCDPATGTYLGQDGLRHYCP